MGTSGGMCFSLELVVVILLMFAAYGAFAVMGLGLIILGFVYMGDESMITNGGIMK